VEGTSMVYPADPAVAFEVDEFVEAFEDVRVKLATTFSIADAAEKEAARAEFMVPGKGAAALILAKIEAYCSKTQAGFMVGNTTTLADIWCFFFLKFLVCGFWDGLPASSVSAEHYPKLFAVVKQVASIPKVRDSLKLLVRLL
jgi:glutathione S-transferase